MANRWHQTRGWAVGAVAAVLSGLVAAVIVVASPAHALVPAPVPYHVWVTQQPLCRAGIAAIGLAPAAAICPEGNVAGSALGSTSATSPTTLQQAIGPLVVSRDATTVLVGQDNNGAGVIARLSAVDGSPLDTVAVTDGIPEEITTTPNGTTAYVATSGFPSAVDVFNSASNSPATRFVALPTNWGSTTATAVSPNGAVLFVAGTTDQSSGEVAQILAFSLAGPNLAANIGTFNLPVSQITDLAITPGGSILYAASEPLNDATPGGNVTAFPLDPSGTPTFTPAGITPTAGYPFSLAITPSGQTIFVGEQTSITAGAVQPPVYSAPVANTLSLAPLPPAGGIASPFASSLAVSPDGQALVVSVHKRERSAYAKCAVGVRNPNRRRANRRRPISQQPELFDTRHHAGPSTGGPHCGQSPQPGADRRARNF